MSTPTNISLHVSERTFDTRHWNNPDYSKWTEGKVYRIIVNGILVFTTGYTHHDYPNLMDENSIRQAMRTQFFIEPWYDISFNHIALHCQKELVEKMGDIFPWSQSAWGSPEMFAEFWEAKTLEGIIARSLLDRGYFYNTVVNGEKKAIFFNAIEEELSVIKSISSPFPYNEKLIKIKDEFYRYKEGLDPLDGHFATLEKISLAEYNNTKAELKERETEEKRARQEHARKCSAMARKYGIPFNISLRCFKGNEKSIKNFVESLKNALGKEFNEHELCCGRARRKAEIERLGINIGYVDPNHISSYILTCLQVGKIMN